MPFQNRVDPFGSFLATAARGTLTGNRGILHDDEQKILRRHVHQNWVTCALAFKGRRRAIMAPGKYTELFFLDEATAFAAGHRPCAECRRQRYAEFTQLWRQVHGEAEPGRPLPRTIDRMLHAHRIGRGGVKVVYEADAATLPAGAFFAYEGQAVLVWDDRQFNWRPDGYEPRALAVGGMVEVLTPQPIVALFQTGFRPLVHDSVLNPPSERPLGRASPPFERSCQHEPLKSSHRRAGAGSPDHPSRH